MLPTTFDTLSIAASAVPEEEIFAPAYGEYSEIVSPIMEKLSEISSILTAVNDNLITLNTWCEQIYTVLVYILAILVIYGVYKLVTGLFIT